MFQTKPMTGTPVKMQNIKHFQNVMTKLNTVMKTRGFLTFPGCIMLKWNIGVKWVNKVTETNAI